MEPHAILPVRATSGSVGYDLVNNGEPVTLKAWGSVKMIGTKLEFAFPDRCFGKIEDRSSLALQGIKTCGGVIDAV